MNLYFKIYNIFKLPLCHCRVINYKLSINFRQSLFKSDWNKKIKKRKKFFFHFLINKIERNKKNQNKKREE